jgi:hypothetical protein
MVCLSHESGAESMAACSLLLNIIMILRKKKTVTWKDEASA